MKGSHGANSHLERKTDTIDPLTFSNLSESEELKRNQNMAKARMSYYSHNLKLRLQYAKLKVEHGWQRQTLSEVENLYFRHTRRPYPATNPRKNALARDLSFGAASGSSKPPIVVDGPRPPSASSSSTTLPSPFSGSFSSVPMEKLYRSDTLQTNPDTSAILSTQSLFQSSSPSGSMELIRPAHSQDTSRSAPQNISSVSASPHSNSHYNAATAFSNRRSAPYEHGAVSIQAPSDRSHPQHIEMDPNIDPALYASAVMQPPATVPPFGQTQAQQQHLSSSSMSMSGETGLTMAAVLASTPSNSGLGRSATVPAVHSPSRSTTSSLPSLPPSNQNPNSNTSSITYPSFGHQPTLSQSTSNAFPQGIQPAPQQPQPISSSSSFGSPLTYDSFWNSHQSSVSTYGLRGLGVNTASPGHSRSAIGAAGDGAAAGLDAMKTNLGGAGIVG